MLKKRFENGLLAEIYTFCIGTIVDISPSFIFTLNKLSLTNFVKICSGKWGILRISRNSVEGCLKKEKKYSYFLVWGMIWKLAMSAIQKRNNCSLPDLFQMKINYKLYKTYLIKDFLVTLDFSISLTHLFLSIFFKEISPLKLRNRT